MIVSWNWLKDYVGLDMEQAELEHRLAMSGLNHEGTESVGDDLAIDLEVTSNRPDCLGHIGVAREIAVLWQQELNIPPASPASSSAAVDRITKVRIDCPELCSRYTARVIQGIKIGPSPDWLADRLTTLGIAVINNVVDISNYVLMESGQPLHAFDLANLAGPEIIVREAHDGEEFEAIDHKKYKLEPGMCVIADASLPVALGGVMGGADSEVSDSTTDLLIESADFAPLSIRNTARKLNLHSPSSYRFERGVDPEGVDWASRRCCELILGIAGGELADGVISVGQDVPAREPIVLRLSQVPRVLGINIEADEIRRILTELGCEPTRTEPESIEIIPPTWRRDLTREIDLIEEVARIHGYDEIPEDVAVPMVPSHRSDEERIVEKVRNVMTGAGFDEAVTSSAIQEDWSAAFSPWTDRAPIVCNTPVLRGAGILRRSLIPSLLEARRINQSLGNETAELFETAKVYLPEGKGLPREPKMLGIAGGGDFLQTKGVIESLVATINPRVGIEVQDTSQRLLDTARSCQLLIGSQTLGYMGEVTPEGLKQFGLRNPATVAEIDLTVLENAAELVPQYQELSQYPAISRDMNFIVDESLRWAALADVVHQSAGENLENVQYLETFRDTKRDGAGKKRLLLTVTLRSSDRTLTSEEADAIRDQIVAACSENCHAQLVA